MPDIRAPAIRPALQFADLAQERDVATIGIWVFLATEMLFFGGLLTSYAVYRHMFADGFTEAARHTKLIIGTINTAVLLTSSFAMAVGVEAAERGMEENRRIVVFALTVTAALGVAFLALKGLEYYQEYQEHLVPGSGFAFDPRYRGPAQLFFLLYFILTGLHGVHVTIGVGLVGSVAAMTRRGAFSTGYTTPIMIVGLYWHFVDVVWIFLYPLIYLVGRSTQ
jgi:cytochrome c oxidase subunit III